MKHIKFNPWVGDNYRQAPFGPRVLVLGESHYQWESANPINECSTLTTELVREQLDGHYRKAFWTHIVVTFLNSLPTLQDKTVFWHSVSFYNYVQESAGMGARVRPTDQMFQASAPAFFELLESLQPEIIVALGYELWARLPRSQSGDETTETDGGPIQTRVYSYPGGSAHACSIKHPSSGFNGRHWHPRVMQIIRTAQQGAAVAPSAANHPAGQPPAMRPHGPQPSFPRPPSPAAVAPAATIAELEPLAVATRIL